MAQKKVKRRRPEIDMTPMVDLGFLLVTFFMMTTQFAPTDLVTVTVPHAATEQKLPESNIATILISDTGTVYFRMDGTRNQKALGNNLNVAFGLDLSEEDIDKFSRMTGYGIPLSGIKAFLQMPETERKEDAQPGIPVYEDRNELGEWLMYARIANPNARMVIKADKKTPYHVVKDVMNTLQAHNINRFGLITDTEETAAEADGVL
jgi:biopolymer transport protein ExbD